MTTILRGLPADCIPHPPIGTFALTHYSIVAVGHGLSRVIFAIDPSHSRKTNLADGSFRFEFHVK